MVRSISAYRSPTRRARIERHPAHRASRIIARSAMPANQVGPQLSGCGIQVSWFHTPREAGRRSLVKGLCRVTLAGGIHSCPVVLVEAKEKKRKELLVPHVLTQVSIKPAEGAVRRRWLRASLSRCAAVAHALHGLRPEFRQTELGLLCGLHGARGSCWAATDVTQRHRRTLLGAASGSNGSSPATGSDEIAAAPAARVRPASCAPAPTNPWPHSTP